MKGDLKMDYLKLLWPTPFKIKEKDLVSFLVQLIIFILLTVLIGVAIWLLSAIPIVNIVASIAGSLMGLYTIVGIVLCVLKFLDVLK